MAWTQRGQQTREYLSDQQWGKPSLQDAARREEQQATYFNDIRTVYDQLDRQNLGQPTMEDLGRVINKLQKRKAPGPHKILQK